MSELCQCDPIGSGEEHCNGGCSRRQHASIRRTIVSLNGAWRDLEPAEGERAATARLLLRHALEVLCSEDREHCAKEPTPNFLQPLISRAAMQDQP